MKKWYIKENICLEEIEFEGTLKEAKKFADERASYTQQDIKIYSEDDRENPVCIRKWWGVEASEDDENTINFGKFGFFADWMDC